GEGRRDAENAEEEMGCPPLFRLLPTSAASASLRFLPIGPKRASGEGCDEWSGGASSLPPS
ncbi:MAG TPA: hypothetical protein VGY54_27340, partial [Polyangiaceae bacterium]|nr:hypothetical protein [Polyangiaceae bacterium]